MLKVGLTGGLACGKTTVAQLFAQKNVPILDADRISHALTAPGSPALGAILACFGPEFCLPDQRLDRRRLRQHIFTHPAARTFLEDLLHPRIKAVIQSEIKQLTERNETPYCLIVVPLLLEARWEDLIDRLLVVDCDPEQQQARFIAREPEDSSLFTAILATQYDRQTRLQAADDVIDNQGDVAHLAAQVDFLDRLYRRLSKN